MFDLRRIPFGIVKSRGPLGADEDAEHFFANSGLNWRNGKLRKSVEWLVRNPDWIMVDRTPRTILQIRPIKECQVTTIRIDWPDFLELSPGLMIGQAMVIEQIAAHGRRCLKVQTLHRRAPITALENMPVAKLPGRQEDPCIWPDDYILHNECPSPEDFWQWCGRLSTLTPGTNQAIGVVVWATDRTRCRCLIGGV